MAPVLIVGAGPAGLALACGLLSSGVDVRLVDAAYGPATTSRALGLQPRGVEVLDRLGALGDLPDRAVHMAGTVIRDVRGRAMLRLVVPEGALLGGRSALTISQAEIEAQLRARIAELGGTIEWCRELIGLTQDPVGVRAGFADGRTEHAEWVVGCDGASSRVRKAAGISLAGHTAVERFLLADARVELPVKRGFATMWAGPEGSLAAVPLPGPDWWRLMAPNPPGQPDELSREAVIEQLSCIARDQVGVRDLDIREVAWTSTFRIHRRLASAYRKDRILLAGDAAHIHGPVGGQGMNTGIGDAENLAWKLALVVDGHATPALLDSYEAERRPIAQAVVSSVGGIDTVLLSKNPLLAFVRDHVLLPLVNRPAMQRWIWHKASQLGISYRTGPLAARPARRLDGRRPGDRVPDLPCQLPDMTPTRLHAELRGHFAVLAGATAHAEKITELVRQRLGDRVTTLLVPDWPTNRGLLVRPDAHLAWHGPDLGTLIHWLDGTLQHGTAR
jgi:4,5-epoxidase